MELAAIATAAVPGLAPTGVASLPDDADDFDSAVIVDAQRNRWRVRSPRHDEASMRLETELSALRSFTPGVRAQLPFRMPSVAGTVRQGTLRTFVYNHLPGAVLGLDTMVAAGGRTAEDVGRAIAAIHGLPEDVVDRADLPSYTANEFRQRRLNELDQAATTGRIPPRLLRRWEHAMEDVALWRFHPTVVHGDLHEENLLLENGRVVAVTGWTDLRIGDPADDFAWLAAVHEQSFADAVFEAYTKTREGADPHIMRRAALAAEFALAQWLARGIATSDAERIAEAEEMLQELDEDIAEYGGQPISVIEPPSFDAPLAGGADGADGAEAAPATAPGGAGGPARVPGSARAEVEAARAGAASGADDDGGARPRAGLPGGRRPAVELLPPESAGESPAAEPGGAAADRASQESRTSSAPRPGPAAGGPAQDAADDGPAFVVSHDAPGPQPSAPGRDADAPEESEPGDQARNSAAASTESPAEAPTSAIPVIEVGRRPDDRGSRDATGT